MEEPLFIVNTVKNDSVPYKGDMMRNFRRILLTLLVGIACFVVQEYQIIKLQSKLSETKANLLAEQNKLDDTNKQLKSTESRLKSTEKDLKNLKVDNVKLKKTNDSLKSQAEQLKEQLLKSKREKVTQLSEKKRVVNVMATAYTAYCSGCSGTTTTGLNLREHPDSKVIAVDPSIIPLGSKVYVEGYGYATASDTGGAIKGRRIDVFFPSLQDALKFGVKHINVTILE